MLAPIRPLFPALQRAKGAKARLKVRINSTLVKRKCNATGTTNSSAAVASCCGSAMILLPASGHSLGRARRGQRAVVFWLVVGGFQPSGLENLPELLDVRWMQLPVARGHKERFRITCQEITRSHNCLDCSTKVIDDVDGFAASGIDVVSMTTPQTSLAASASKALATGAAEVSRHARRNGRRGSSC